MQEVDRQGNPLENEALGGPVASDTNQDITHNIHKLFHVGTN